MRQAVRQIVLCALALIAFCIVCRLTVFRTYTAYLPLRSSAEAAPGPEDLRVEMEEPGILRLGEGAVRGGYLRVPVYPEGRGKTDLRVFDPNGEELAFYLLRVGRFGTVYDPQTAGFTGDTAVLIAVTLFWLAVSAIMLWHYSQAKGPAYYAYSTIYFAGFSLFALLTGLVMLRVTAAHILQPGAFGMFAAYGAINGASMQFMMLTLPVMAAFVAALAVSNAALLRHEKPRVQNVLGLIVSAVLIGGEALGVVLFTRNFMGSEWEARLHNTLQNVYATLFVYFECMLMGSVICGIGAARHQPAPDRDFIIIVGCWFRRDGSLPPLLRGRVDRALAFWRQQKEQTGKTAILIASGGQGADEPMPEAEAMRRYLLAQGVPEECIRTETQSKNTCQNLAFSKAIMDAIRADGKCAFATTNYHVFRSGVWAAQAGLKAEGIGGKTKWWFWPNAFLRECVGLMHRRWKQEILFLILMMAFFGALSMALGA
ncbi:MAG: DUF218 domain-containing protein [Clostridiales bacterium]|nr:DUF218 domain-containing protein [Clostridiales bacterium]